MSADAAGPDEYAECAGCRHYPAYCPAGGTGCTAWDPEQPDNKCACPGRTEKPAPAQAVTVTDDRDDGGYQ